MTNPAEAGLYFGGPDYCLRRRDAAGPARPRPSSARVAGSGTLTPSNANMSSWLLPLEIRAPLRLLTTCRIDAVDVRIGNCPQDRAIEIDAFDVSADVCPVDRADQCAGQHVAKLNLAAVGNRDLAVEIVESLELGVAGNAPAVQQVAGEIECANRGVDERADPDRRAVGADAIRIRRADGKAADVVESVVEDVH